MVKKAGFRGIDTSKFSEARGERTEEQKRAIWLVHTVDALNKGFVQKYGYMVEYGNKKEVKIEMEEYDALMREQYKIVNELNSTPK